MSRYRKFTMIAAVAALAFGLAACGSSDDDQATVTDPPVVDPTPDPAIEQRAAISSAIDTATAEVAVVTDAATDDEVAAAETAIAAATAAIAAATDVPADETAANSGTVAAIGTTLANAKASRMAALDAAADATKKTMDAAGKALHTALGKDPLGNLDTAFLDTKGLTIKSSEKEATSVILIAGASAGALGAWNGTHYSKTDTGTKVTDSAVVYTNQAAAKSQEFGKAHTALAEGSLPKDKIEIALVMADAFTHSGTQTHAVPDRMDAVYVRGTYDGAPGEYSCPKDCSSANDGKGSPSNLEGWAFTPDKGAMVSQPDATYLYYGWWLRTDDTKDEPKLASAFHNAESVSSIGEDNSPNSLSGSATYAGSAAGKFAINDPLSGGDAGHFTADATLTAKFGATDKDTLSGISGTIDNFMADDKSVPWSVSLKLAPWDKEKGTFANPGAGSTLPTAYARENKGTVWSIDGNSAAASGSWEGEMYDEKPGLTTDTPPGDGSNIPTSVTGKFQSEFGSTHSMVGAFGATR